MQSENGQKKKKNVYKHKLNKKTEVPQKDNENEENNEKNAMRIT